MFGLPDVEARDEGHGEAGRAGGQPSAGGGQQRRGRQRLQPQQGGGEGARHAQEEQVQVASS